MTYVIYALLSFGYSFFMTEKISCTVDELKGRGDFGSLMNRVAAGTLEIEIVASGTGQRRAIMTSLTTVAMLQAEINRLSAD